MITCPNKALKSWKNLVKAVGEPTAYLLWNEYQGEVPSSFYETKLEQEIKEESNLNYVFKSVEKLFTPKGKEIWNKGYKNNWDITKTLTEIGVPKEQKAILEDIYNNMLTTGVDDKGKDFLIKPTLDEVMSVFLANYSYTVEINTAKKIQSYDDYIAEGGEIGKEYLTDYYSTLTVPGGTNYTENEIATPLITPSIKGHAEFSTDNGIGWFRSDEQIKLEDNLLNDLPNNFQVEFPSGKFEYRKENNNWNLYKLEKNSFVLFNKNEPIEEVKNAYNKRYNAKNIVTGNTRRILEVQSDLFQKGRNEKNLATQISKKSVNTANIFINDEYSFTLNDIIYESKVEMVYYEDENQTEPTERYYANGKRIGFAEIEAAKEEYLASKPVDLSNQNNFLQLLNKDNNWVTFFIKSIIQDSAKKGYEKVLFPTGNTASKIEGHDTLEEFKKQNEDRIKELEEEKKEINKYGTTVSSKEVEDALAILANFPEDKYALKTLEQSSETQINDINNKINQLKQELKRVETEGFGALKPIYNFYENTVTNILKKNFPVTQITDEYGNTWNELDINEIESKQSLTVQLAIEDSQAVAYYDNNGKIILKPGYVPTEELLIHEFSHPFVDRIAEDNPNVFNKLLKDINSTEEGKEIFNYVQENYSEKDSITKRKEVLVRAIAMVGKGYINKKTGNPIIQAVKKFLKFVTSMINRRLNEKMKTKDVIYATDLDLQTTVEEIAQLITMYEGKISTSKTDRLDNPEFNKLPKDIQDKLLPRIMEGRLVKVVENGLNSYYSLLGKTFQRQSDYNKNIKEFNPDNPSFKDSVTNLNNATVVGNYIDILSREFFKNPNITFKQAVEFFKDPQFKGILNEMSFNSTITQLKRVKSELQKIHGENAAFITEEFFLFKEGEVEGFDGVAGKTDIIVVDDKGKFHVYDVKNKFVKQSAEEAKNKINKRFREGEPSDIEKWSKQQETYSEMFKSITKEPFVTKNVIVFPVTYEREVFTGETINDVQEFKPVPTINEGRFIKDNAFIMSTIKADVKLPEPKVIPKAPIVAPNTIKKEATKVDEELQIPDEVLMGGLPQGYWDSVLGKNSSAPTTNTNLNTMPSPASKTAMPSKLEIAQKMQEARNRRKNEIPNLSPENKRIFESEEFKEWARKNAANDYTSSLKELIENYNKCHP